MTGARAAALAHPCRARSGSRRAQPQGAAIATRNGKTTGRCVFGAGERVAGRGVTGGVRQLQQCRRSSSSTSASPSSSIASRSASIAPASVSSHSALTAASSRGRPGRCADEGCAIVGCREAPRPGVVLTDHLVTDAQPRPVEVAVVMQRCSGGTQLREQDALGCGRHAVGAYERCTAQPQLVGGDREQVRVLADEDRTARNGPGRRRSYQAA